MIHKTVTVEKDPEGKIIRILEVEEITQEWGSSSIIILDHVKLDYIIRTGSR
jgi:hypothetical protein